MRPTCPRTPRGSFLCKSFDVGSPCQCIDDGDAKESNTLCWFSLTVREEEKRMVLNSFSADY